MKLDSTNQVYLVTRSQAFFRAFALPERLSVIEPHWIDHLHLELPLATTPYIRAWLGRGPVAHRLGSFATLFFEHGEQSYPVFTFPSLGPSNAALKLNKLERTLVADERTAIFGLEVALIVGVPRRVFSQEQRGELDTHTFATATDARRTTQSILDTLVGAYALYQYPLVWEPLHQRNLFFFLDLATQQMTTAKEHPPTDNFIPFLLDPAAKLSNENLYDGVMVNASRIPEADISEALVLLKDSLWHSDIRTRFLLQFWIVEYFADRYTAAIPDDEARRFADSLHQLVAEHMPSHLPLFLARKGELVRRTLVQKVESCFAHLRITYNDALFKRAKRVRDSLSHGSAYDRDELAEMERYIREIARHMIRRDLELKGIFLDGAIPDAGSELPMIVPAYRSNSEASFRTNFGPT